VVNSFFWYYFCMTLRNKKVLGAALAILLTATIGFFIFTKSEGGGAKSLPESAINIPNGWYLHRMTENTVLLTKQQELPDIGATEGWAYGEQIAISSQVLSQPIEDWIASRVPENDPLYTAREQGNLNGYRTLRAEHEVGATGKAMDYYLFTNSRVYIFSLYPLELTGPTGKVTRNTTDIKILDQLVKDFIERL